MLVSEITGLVWYDHRQKLFPQFKITCRLLNESCLLRVGQYHVLIWNSFLILSSASLQHCWLPPSSSMAHPQEKLSPAVPESCSLTVNKEQKELNVYSMHVKTFVWLRLLSSWPAEVHCSCMLLHWYLSAVAFHNGVNMFVGTVAPPRWHIFPFFAPGRKGCSHRMCHQDFAVVMLGSTLQPLLCAENSSSQLV